MNFLAAPILALAAGVLATGSTLADERPFSVATVRHAVASTDRGLILDRGAGFEERKLYFLGPLVRIDEGSETILINCRDRTVAVFLSGLYDLGGIPKRLEPLPQQRATNASMRMTLRNVALDDRAFTQDLLISRLDPAGEVYKHSLIELHYLRERQPHPARESDLRQFPPTANLSDPPYLFEAQWWMSYLGIQAEVVGPRWVVEDRVWSFWSYREWKSQTLGGDEFFSETQRIVGHLVPENAPLFALPDYARCSGRLPFVSGIRGAPWPNTIAIPCPTVPDP